MELAIGLLSVFRMHCSCLGNTLELIRFQTALSPTEEKLQNTNRFLHWHFMLDESVSILKLYSSAEVVAAGRNHVNRSEVAQSRVEIKQLQRTVGDRIHSHFLVFGLRQTLQSNSKSFHIILSDGPPVVCYQVVVKIGFLDACVFGGTTLLDYKRQKPRSLGPSDLSQHGYGGDTTTATMTNAVATTMANDNDDTRVITSLDLQSDHV